MLKSKCRSNCATHTQTIIKFSRLCQISLRDFVRGVWVPLSQINKRIRRILFALFYLNKCSSKLSFNYFYTSSYLFRMCVTIYIKCYRLLSTNNQLTCACILVLGFFIFFFAGLSFWSDARIFLPLNLLSTMTEKACWE